MARPDESKIAHLECKNSVLRDVLRRAGWYLGTDIQSSPPTQDEIAAFYHEVRSILGKE